MDYHQCCNILDLVPPVTLEDAKQAYKDLVQVWHPDRFTHSPRLQERAEAKLKQLNLAYETLVPLLQAQQKLFFTHSLLSLRYACRTNPK